MCYNTKYKSIKEITVLTSVFPKTEEFLVFRTRKRMRIFYFTLLAIYVIGVMFMLVFNLIMVNNYGIRDYIEVCKWTTVGVSLAFGWFSIFFWCTKYRYTKSYANLFKSIKNGLKDKSEGVFTGFVFEIRTKDGVEFYSMKVKCEPKDRRFETVDREILIYREVPPLPVAYGQKIRFITHSNILIAFEIEDSAEKREKSEA